MLSRLPPLFIVLLFLAASPVDAAILKGAIRANEVEGEPLENVNVVADGANPTSSEAFGRFTLEFPNKKPGDTVEVIAKQEGWVVVNDVQLQVTLSARPEDKVLTIILCKEDDREEMARRFYRLKNAGAIAETYKERLKELEKTQQASASAFAKLLQERDQVMAILAKAVAEWAKVQQGQTSELYQQALRLFLDGKIEEALKVLDDQELRQFVTPPKRSVEDAVKAWLLKAQFLIVQFRFDEAEATYLAAIDMVPDNFIANFAFASFNDDLKHYDKATAAYARCVELAKKGENNAELALTLNSLGNVYRNQNRMDAAQEEYEEALKTYRLLARNDPETYLPEVARTLDTLGDLYKDQDRLSEAFRAHMGAQEIRSGLASATPEAATPEERATPAPERTPVPATPSNSPGSDSYEKLLAAAQEMVRQGDWQGALKGYLDLADRYPDRQVALDAASYSQLKPYLVRAAGKGVVPAMLILGQFSREGEPAEAMKWLESAAAKGSVPAMIEAGLLLHSNRRQSGDDRKALEYFLQAASMRDRIGKYLAGECYMNGEGVQRGPETAASLFRQGAEKCDPSGMFFYASCLQDGLGLPTVSGQKPTLSLCGIDLSQRQKADARAWPAIQLSVLRDERIGFLLSEVDLPRFGVFDSRIIRSLHGLNLR